MDTNILLSKNYINEVVSDYQDVVCQVDEIIKQTGYNGKFIAKKMGLPASTFYQKKRKKSFSVEEMKQIVELMDENDKDVIENEYFMKLFQEREHEENIPNGLDILKKRRDERRN